MKSPASPTPTPVFEELLTFVQTHSPGACIESLRYEVELQLWISNLCHFEQTANLQREAVPAADAVPATRAETKVPQGEGLTSPSRRRSGKRVTKQEYSDSGWLLRPWAMA